MSNHNKNFQSRFVGAARAWVLLSAVAIAIAGCGGDGGYNGYGGGGGNGGPVTISGTIQTSAKAPVSGWAVGFDVAQTSNYETTTNAAGQYTITIPANAITGSDTLSVADPTGNVWYNGSISANMPSVQQNITLPAYDTIAGTITQSTGSPAANYEVRFVTADTAVNTGLYWSAFTNAGGAYTLNLPVTIVNESSTIPVVTGYDDIYINSYPSQNTLDGWFAGLVQFSTAGGVSYTLSETLPASPIFTDAATGQPYFKVKTQATHGVAIEPASRSLPQATVSRLR
jgi:hypothetical protein